MTRLPDACSCQRCPIHSHPLALARRRAGWSQKEAARILGCHPNHVADIEYGRKGPSALLLDKMRVAYDAPELSVPINKRGRPRKVGA